MKWSYHGREWGNFTLWKLDFARCCVHVPEYEHIKSPYLFYSFFLSFPLFLISSLMTDRQKSAVNSKLTCKSNLLGLIAVFLLLICFVSFANLHFLGRIFFCIHIFWYNEGYLFCVWLCLINSFNILSKSFCSQFQWRDTERQWVELLWDTDGPAIATGIIYRFIYCFDKYRWISNLIDYDALVECNAELLGILIMRINKYTISSRTTKTDTR